MRVLQVITSMNIGGMESIIMNMNRNMDIKFDFLLFDIGGKQYYEDEIKSLGGKIYKVTPRRCNLIKNRREMKEFFKTHKYDVVHIHQGITYLLPLKLAHKYKTKKIIVHNHSVDGKYKKGLYNIIRKLYVIPYIDKTATHFFACSKLVLEDLYTKERIKNNGYYVLNNAIDVKKYLYNEKVRNKIRKELNLENEFVIGHVGRFFYPKNHEFIIELAKKLPQYKFLLVGTGEDLEKYKAIASDNVIFYGSSSEVYNIMQAFDLFILPSRWEGLPLVAVEAQSSGLPLILSDAVSTEADITGNVKYLPLDINKWVKQIEKYKNFERTNTYELIKKGGFDAKTEAKKLEKIYMEDL